MNIDITGVTPETAASLMEHHLNIAALMFEHCQCRVVFEKTISIVKPAHDAWQEVMIASYEDQSA